ncbi:efflux RND transporter periplasmic adaptor subunit [uncultured Algimonas sp.]|uniref:efflux RND transporter periplasmic adaptor subunit n=1 Tax=uncultured Algimonas sp. TaxID=1547920 RepID=UPI0026274FB1|nr:efflux RND transporter periplasmic adaptor subunit [uncultured Algimonas sp.]
MAWVSLIVFLSTCPGMAQSDAPAVVVEPVQQSTFADTLEAVGTLRAAETVVISSTVTEQVERIGFDDGDRVTRGQMLIRFEAREEEARFDEAEATIGIAREEMERARRLFDRGALSESELLSRQRDLALAEAQIQSSRVQRSDRVIRAPFDGVVGLRQISVGAIVRPGDPIVRIDQTDTLNLDFPMPATRLSALAPGQTVTARASARPDRVFSGEVTTLDSFIDPVTRSVLVRAELDNQDGLLKPGMLMTVEVASAPREALLVDESAVVPFGRDVSVYRIVERDGEQVVLQTPVTLGNRRPGQVEILSGLSVGDLVVTHGTLKVRPGQTVEPIRVDPGEDALARYLEIQGG